MSEDQPKYTGVDVGQPGGDKTVIAGRTGGRFTFIDELSIGAKLACVGNQVVVISPGEPPQLVTPEGLKPLDGFATNSPPGSTEGEFSP